MSTARREKLFIDACENGKLSLVKQHLFKETIDINCSDGLGLVIATKNNHMEVVKYLLNSPDLKNHANLNTYFDSAFRAACANGRAEILEYFFTKCKEQPSMEKWGDVSLVSAVNAGHMDIVQYLLTSPHLSQHANINAHNNAAFLGSVDHPEIMNYFLYDLKIQFSDDDKSRMKDFLNSETKYQEIIKILDTRDFVISLESQMKGKSYSPQKVKI